MGCPKNEVDSDGMEMLLRDAAYAPTSAPDDADVLIVNTCGFLEAAKEESIGVLRDLAASKSPHQALIAAGCLAQRNGSEVLDRVPEVDGLLGTRRWMDVLELTRLIRGRQQSARPLQKYDLLGDDQVSSHAVALLGDPDVDFTSATPRPPVLGGSAYLKISDGCNAPCAFCTIPSFKGKLRSSPVRRRLSKKPRRWWRQGAKRTGRRRAGYDGLRARSRRAELAGAAAGCHLRAHGRAGCTGCASCTPTPATSATP